jgi:hypothetical protein
VSDLREDLDAALRTLQPGQAPFDAVIRRGRRIRARRWVVAIAGTAAVAVAVAMGYPAMSNRAAGPRPAQPASRQPARITDMPGPAGAPAGLIARGQVGTTQWQVSVDKPAGQGKAGPPRCFDVALTPGVASKAGWYASTPLSGSVLDNGGFSDCDLRYPGQQAPAALEGTGGNSIYVMAGGVAASVRYLVIKLASGQVVKAIPHPAYGLRFVAYAAPISDRVVGATAYTDDGQLMSAVPFIPPAGGVPVFGLWAAPGQPLPPAATIVLSSGIASGRRWSVTAYEGPWGTCVVAAASGLGGSSTACRNRERTTALSVLGRGDSGGTMPFEVSGFAPPAATRLEVTLTHGRRLGVPVLAVGNERLWAFTLADGQAASGLTAYNAAGQPVGSASVPQTTATAP